MPCAVGFQVSVFVCLANRTGIFYADSKKSQSFIKGCSCLKRAIINQINPNN